MLTYKGLATYLFGRIVDKYGSAFSFVKESLVKAGMKTTFRSYMSMVFLTSIIAYFLSFGVIFFFFSNILQVSLVLFLIYSIFIPTLISLTVFFSLCFIPYQKKISKTHNIETSLPFVLTHMGAIAESGVPPTVIFRVISQFEEYGEISKEMKKIVNYIDGFGIDPITAIKEVAKRTPSDEFRQVLLGFVTTTESGGDITAYLKNAGERALFEWRMRRQRFLQQLTTYAEIYTGVLIAAPLFLITLFAVMNLVSGAMPGYNLLELMKLSIYLVIPVLNVGFIFLLRGVEVEI